MDGMNLEPDFYANLPVFTLFADLVDPAVYRPLPEDWIIGLTDVVESTGAIQAGRYKVVNTVGASVIAAMTNALQQRAFPFSFGGDGASFAIAPRDAGLAREALASTAAWARDDLGLTLRVALVPVSAVRQHGRDVRVARYAPSPHVSYAMFSGGGLAWAERAIKDGAFAVQPGPEGARPDLTGLSCRWQEIPASRGLILSFVLVPLEAGEQPAFRELVGRIIALIENSKEAASPVEHGGPDLGSPLTGFDLEAKVSRPAGRSAPLHRAGLLVRRVLSYLVFRFEIPVGRFQPALYRRELAQNSDHRKYDDGLRMTLDCTTAFADRLEAALLEARAQGVAQFGLHRQGAALMTCITPSALDSRHVHFLDGAMGGYAAAVSQMRSSSTGRS